MIIKISTNIGEQRIVGIDQLSIVAEQGNDIALNVLGEWLTMGYECEPDSRLALQLFDKAARMGNSQAMLNLGLVYLYGKGVDVDYYAAERWIMAAGECGDEQFDYVCFELFLSSANGHKPDLRTPVNLLFKDRSVADRRRAIAAMAMEHAGKTNYKSIDLNKVTDQDIEALEKMLSPDAAVSTLEAEKLLTSQKKKEYVNKLVGIAKDCDEDELGAVCRLLYFLCAAEKKRTLEKIAALYKISDDTAKISTLSWLEMASLDAGSNMKGEFKDLNSVINQIELRFQSKIAPKLESIYSLLQPERICTLEEKSLLEYGNYIEQFGGKGEQAVDAIAEIQRQISFLHEFNDCAEEISYPVVLEARHLIKPAVYYPSWPSSHIICTDRDLDKAEEQAPHYCAEPDEHLVFVYNENPILDNMRNGIYLTNKRLFLNYDSAIIKSFRGSISAITSVSAGSLGAIKFVVNGENKRIGASDVKDKKQFAALLYEAIMLLNKNNNTINQLKQDYENRRRQSAVAHFAKYAPPHKETAEDERNLNNLKKPDTHKDSHNKWLCECGGINSSNFCTKCGKSKDTGKPIWICDCGAMNTGRFCTQCGKQRKEN